MGVSPVLIHFRIFHEINHPTIGVSPFMDPPLASMSWAELVAGCGLGGFSDLEASGQSKRRAVWQHFWIKHSRKIWKNTVERSVGTFGMILDIQHVMQAEAYHGLFPLCGWVFIRKNGGSPITTMVVKPYYFRVENCVFSGQFIFFSSDSCVPYICSIWKL